MKKHILTGLIILLPVVLTIMVIIFLFDFLTQPLFTIVNPLVELIEQRIGFEVPHEITLFLTRLLSLIFLVLFIFILGAITQWFLIKSLMNLADRIMFRIPFIRTIYKVSRDIFSALFATEGKKAFKRAVMVPFPSEPNYCLGFVAGEVAPEIQEKIKTPLVSVFAPTAPHPISGFLFLVPEKEVHYVDMTNEEVVKFLVSCGMIIPESEQKTENEDDLF
jgi:uncharacterized membrane protein